MAFKHFFGPSGGWVNYYQKGVVSSGVSSSGSSGLSAWFTPLSLYVPWVVDIGYQKAIHFFLGVPVPQF